MSTTSWFNTFDSATFWQQGTDVFQLFELLFFERLHRHFKTSATVSSDFALKTKPQIPYSS
jgi:hypothetical protein